MGIRINKVLGYGFQKSGGSKDPRLSEKFSKIMDYEHEEDFNVEEFIKFCKRKKVEIGRYNDFFYSGDEIRKVQRLDYNSFFKCNREYSKTCPLIFTNPFNSGWYRYDDDIDHIENVQRNRGIKDEIIIPRNDGGGLAYIYPYATYVDRRTGERVVMRDYMHTNDINIVPKPPDVILFFCEFVGVFKNPLNVYRLKPMLYTYWE